MATIGTYSSQNTGQTCRSIHDFIGLNGAHTLTQTSFFGNPDVNIQLRDFRPSYLRYPGGTLANYWDWQEGWLFSGISNNGCISLLPDDTKLIQSIPLPENGTTYSLGKLELASGLYMLKISSPGLEYKSIKLSKQ